jgi:CRISPR-associated protein Cas8b/Csh1 subtype I-B
MIQTLYNIGQAIKDHPDYEAFFQPWGNPFPGREDDAKVIVAEIEKKKFVKLRIESFRKIYLNKYLFRPGSTKGRATNSVPTIPFIDKDTSFDKAVTSINKIGSNWVGKSEIDLMKEAIEDLELNVQTPYLFTITIDGKYLGEYPTLVEKFEDNAYQGFGEKQYSRTIESSAKDYVCALSGKKSSVYGFVNSLGFTVNDDAFMRNGFSQSDSYKMFPVSHEAAKVLSGITSLVFTDSFSNSFHAKVKYLLLPKFITRQDDHLYVEVFNLFRKKQALNINSNKGAKGANGFITKTDGIISEIIEDEELNRNDILYDILFFEKDKSQFNLLSNITDVRPSRLEHIMKCKSDIEKFYAPITNFDDGKKQYTFRINLVELKNLMLTEQGKKQIPHPYFYRLTEAIFYGHQVNKKIFLQFLLDHVRKASKQLHENKYALGNSVKVGFVLLQFLERLSIYKNHNKPVEMENNTTEVKKDAFGFITLNPQVTNT